MTKSDDPWQLDGVTKAAREAAERAAAREGVNLGAWLEAAIREVAAEDGGQVSADDIVAAIETLSAHIAATETAAQESLAPLRDRLESLSLQIADIEETAARDPLSPGD